MPVAKIQLPDGRIAKFEVPEGTTPEQVTQFASQQFKVQPPTEKPLNPTDDMSTTERVAAGAGSAVADMGIGIKQGLTEYGNQQTLGQQLSPQQQMTLLYGGHNLNNKLIPDSAVADVQKEVDEKRRLDAPLMDTDAGKVGNIAGNIAMTLPALAVPGANTLTGSTIMGGLMGLAQPTAQDESRGLNGLKGAGTSALAYGLGSIPGKLSQMASGKVAQIENEIAQKAANVAASETATARSAAGNAAQNAYRQLEHLRELNAKGLLSEEGQQVAAALEKELGEKAAEKLLPATAQKEATAKAYQEAMDNEAERASKLAAEKLSGKEALNQIMARVKRYWPGLVGAGLGHMVFPGIGGALGGFTGGIAIRPSVRSMVNLLKNPALQRQALKPLANSTIANSKNLPLALALMGSSVNAGQQ